MWRSLELGVGALAFDLDCGRFEGCANGGTGACASPIPSRLTIISLCAGDTKIDEAVFTNEWDTEARQPTEFRTRPSDELSFSHVGRKRVSLGRTLSGITLGSWFNPTS